MVNTMQDERPDDKNKPASDSLPLEEGIDFYFDEKGLMVFTEAYHLKRGYCCNNGCRHCPYKCKISGGASGSNPID